MPGWAQAPNSSDAMALEQQGKLIEAEQNWRLVVRQNPRDAAAYASLGLVLSKEGKYAEAVPAYRKALTLNANLPGVQLNLGLAEVKQGEIREAIGPVRAALGAGPQKIPGPPVFGLGS